MIDYTGPKVKELSSGSISEQALEAYCTDHKDSNMNRHSNIVGQIVVYQALCV